VIDVVRVGLWLHKLGKDYYKVGKLNRLQQVRHPDVSMGFPGTQPHPVETTPTAVSETAVLVPQGHTAVRARRPHRICPDGTKTGDTFFTTANGKRLHLEHCHHLRGKLNNSKHEVGDCCRKLVYIDTTFA
jgi:hypothetical protein